MPVLSVFNSWIWKTDRAKQTGKKKKKTDETEQKHKSNRCAFLLTEMQKCDKNNMVVTILYG